MAGAAEDSRLDLVSRLTAAFGAEIDLHDPEAPIPSGPPLPTVQSMVIHVGGVHRWVTEILRTRGPVKEDPDATLPAAELRVWFEEGRAALLAALAAVPADAPCWIIGSGVATAGFWRRRMIYENVKHLMDVRAAGRNSWEIAPELSTDDYADGIDELLSVFLPRSRPKLPALPGTVVLRATDSGRAWRISRDWIVDADAHALDGSATLVARTGDLALALWDRADPARDRSRFRIEGSLATVAALSATALHPW